jgi:hypothetical protein
LKLISISGGLEDFPPDWEFCHFSLELLLGPSLPSLCSISILIFS